VQNDTQTYDIIFVGAGASSSLILFQLKKRNLLNKLSVLVVDSELKTGSDKTFCFWAEEESRMAKELDFLIKHSWKSIVDSCGDIKEILPYKYHHIDSLDLYNYVREIEVDSHFDRLNARVGAVSRDEQGPYILVDEKIFRGKTIFDSRTPVFKKTAKVQEHLYQSFIGWVIETEQDLPESDSFRLMDFDIEQNGFTQFMYVLPFSKNKALIEVTRFGNEPIETTGAEALLQGYANKNYGDFKIVSHEVGCIPMSNFEIERNNDSGIFPIGANGGQIKPSTGYAFKNMYEQSLVLADRIENDMLSLQTLSQKNKATPKRFAFYDSILLTILGSRPEKGKSIFLALFQKNETNVVLKFLDEKTTIWEEVLLFSRLPLVPFLSALIQLFFHSRSFRPTMLIVICSTLFLLGNHTAPQDILGYGLLLIGFVTVGIPHGAIDHLIESGNWELKGIAKFSLNYISKALIMMFLWILSPQIALLFFLLFSSWHFGQTDGKNWRFSSLTSFLWGASVLIYILGTHTKETAAILSAIDSHFFKLAIPFWSLFPWFIVALITKRTSFVLTLVWLLLSSQLPLILAFGIYFVGQHSLSSWSHSSEYLKLSNKSMWMHSLPFHLGAWALLAITMVLNTFFIQTTDAEVWGIFFIFIACISFPHVIWMHKLYTRNSI
jgi:lycopene beta-cyclase